MIYDLLITGGTIITGDGPRQQQIAIKNGKIQELLPNDQNPQALKQYQADGCYIFSGGIDVHVHMEDLGTEEVEDWGHGSYAAASGGVTTVVDMPIDCVPSTVTAENVRKKLRRIQGKSYVDYLLWGGLSGKNLNEIPGMLKEGVVGLKSFLVECGIGDYPMTTDDVLEKAMKMAVEMDFPIMIHAESEALNQKYTNIYAKSRDYKDWTYMHPIEGETEAVSRCIYYAKKTGARIHIAHVSNGQTLEVIRRAKREKVRVTCETCPHYLYFTEDDYGKKGAYLKCAPPVRTMEDREYLWRGIKDGTIDMVSSDHSPSLFQENGPYVKDAWAGVSGLQQSLLVLYEEGYIKRGIKLSTIADVFSGSAAKLLGVEHKKGSIEVGKDADLAIMDPAVKTLFQKSNIETKRKETVYLGEEMQGKIRSVFLRGNIICENKPEGLYIRRR